MRVRIGPQCHAGQGDGGDERIRRQDSPDFALSQEGEAKLQAALDAQPEPAQAVVV